jgi:hypothetical protein
MVGGVAAARIAAELIAAGNGGILTHVQARTAGLGDRAIARLLAVGEWTAIGRGVYAARPHALCASGARGRCQASRQQRRWD